MTYREGVKTALKRHHVIVKCAKCRSLRDGVRVGINNISDFWYNDLFGSTHLIRNVEKPVKRKYK